MANAVVGRCNLCSNNGVLSRGHIFPQWCGRLTDNKKMIKLFSRTVFPDGKIQSVNKSKYMDISEIHKESSYNRLEGLAADYLFCEKCDNELGKGEEILREIIHPTKNISYIARNKLNTEAKIRFLITDPNKETQLLQSCIGILLKAHYSQHDMYKNFRIEKTHVRVIRDAIEKQKINTGRFSLEFAKLYNFSQEILFPEPQESLRFGPARPHAIISIEVINGTYILIAGGFLLTIKINKQSGKKVLHKPFKRGNSYRIVPLDIAFLVSDEMNISALGIYKAIESNAMDRIFQDVLKDPNLRIKLCPCFVFYSYIDNYGNKKYHRKSFEECCIPYWY